MALQRAFQSVLGHTMIKNESYQVVPPMGDSFSISDLPISSMAGKTTHPVAYVEIIELMEEPSFDGLDVNAEVIPDPFRFAMGGTPQYYTTKPIENKIYLIKLVSFDGRTNHKLIRDSSIGDLYTLKMIKGHAPRHVQTAIHYMCLRMGGKAYVDQTLEMKNKAEKVRTPEELRLGFDHIKEYGPLGTDENQNVEWAESQRADIESPLYGWNASIIKESLGNITRGRATAQAQKYYPVTLKDVKSAVLQDLVIPFLAKSGEHGAIWAGASGIGKTPLSRAIAMALSEYHIHEHTRAELVPHFRAGNHLDFFRGAIGTIFGPSIYDDGEPADNRPGDLKTFLDPSEPEVRIKKGKNQKPKGHKYRVHRCETLMRLLSTHVGGCARFGHHQSRQLCTNAFDSAAEPDATNNAVMTHKEFMTMLMPMFPPRSTTQDIMAIVKRAFAIVFGEHRIYVRAPSASQKAPIKVFQYWPQREEHDLLLESGIAKLKDFRAGSNDPPATDMEDRQWQLRLLKLVLNGADIPKFKFGQVTEMDETGVVVSRSSYDRKPDLVAAVQALRDNTTSSPPVFMEANYATELGLQGGAASTAPGDEVHPEVLPDEGHREGVAVEEPAAKRQRTSTIDDPEIDGEPFVADDLELALAELMEEAPTFGAEDGPRLGGQDDNTPSEWRADAFLKMQKHHATHAKCGLGDRRLAIKGCLVDRKGSMQANEQDQSTKATKVGQKELIKEPCRRKVYQNTSVDERITNMEHTTWSLQRTTQSEDGIIW